MSHFQKELVLRILGYGLPLASAAIARKWGAEYGAPVAALGAWIMSQAEKGTLPKRKRMFPDPTAGNEEKTDPGAKHG